MAGAGGFVCISWRCGNVCQTGNLLRVFISARVAQAGRCDKMVKVGRGRVAQLVERLTLSWERYRVTGAGTGVKFGEPSAGKAGGDPELSLGWPELGQSRKV